MQRPGSEDIGTALESKIGNRKSIMSFFKVNDRCNGCLACVENCPASALRAEDTGDQRTLSHNRARCARCGQCWRVCPQKAVAFEHLLTGPWEPFVSIDLIRCRICDTPIHAAPFADTLNSKREASAEELCPKHRRIRSAAAWPRLGRGRKKSSEPPS